MAVALRMAFNSRVYGSFFDELKEARSPPNSQALVRAPDKSCLVMNPSTSSDWSECGTIHSGFGLFEDVI